MCSAGADALKAMKLPLCSFGKFTVCHAGKTKIRLQRATSHAQNPGHKAIESIMSATDPGTECDGNSHLMPGLSEWDRVLRETVSGNAVSQEGIPGIGKRRKVQKMQFCFAEAMRARTRRQFQEAVSIGISQDKRGTRFLMRYRACNKNLEVSDGVICLLKLNGGDVACKGADQIRKATMDGIVHVMSPQVGPFPSTDKKPVAAPKASLLVEIAAKVEALAADAASDEQLAGKELADGLNQAGPNVRPIRDSLLQSLPGLKVMFCFC